jgi:hypothetical protein
MTVTSSVVYPSAAVKPRDERPLAVELALL